MLLEKQYKIIYPEMTEQKRKKKRSYKQLSQQSNIQLEEDLLEMTLKKSKPNQSYQNIKIVGLFKMEKSTDSYSDPDPKERLLEISQYKDIDALYYMPNWKKKQQNSKELQLYTSTLHVEDWENYSKPKDSYKILQNTTNKDFVNLKKEILENNINKMQEEFC